MPTPISTITIPAPIPNRNAPSPTSASTMRALPTIVPYRSGRCLLLGWPGEATAAETPARPARSADSRSTCYFRISCDGTSCSAPSSPRPSTACGADPHLGCTSPKIPDCRVYRSCAWRCVGVAQIDPKRTSRCSPSPETELNRRLPTYEEGALPTELSGRGCNVGFQSPPLPTGASHPEPGNEPGRNSSDDGAARAHREHRVVTTSRDNRNRTCGLPLPKRTLYQN